MRALTLIVLSSLFLNSLSQQVTPVNCFKGEKNDILKSIEKFSPDTYLLDIRSQSEENDFPNNSLSNDTFPFFFNSWLAMMNTGGDTLWKRMIPNTNQAFYIQYMPSFLGVFPYPVFDYSHSIYTKLDDEIALHYTYIKGIDSFMYGNLGIRDMIVEFGLLNIDGSYALYPFPIDTVLRDSNIQVRNMTCVKVNDSIYQVSCQFSKLEIYVFETSGMAYTRIYTINTRSLNVSTLEFVGYEPAIYHVDDRMYVFEDNFWSDDDTADYLHKVGIDGDIEATLLLSDSARPPDLSVTARFANGKFVMSGHCEGQSTSNVYAIWFVIDPVLMTFEKHTLHHQSSLSNSSSYAYPVGYSFGYPESYTKRSVNNFLPYFMYSEHGIEDSQYVSKKFLVKYDSISGDVILITPASLSGSFNEIVEGGFLEFSDSTYYIAGRENHHNKITKTGWDGNEIWSGYLPDKLTADSTMYIPAGRIIDYYPVNYNGQFIVAYKYIDTAHSNRHLERLFYFFVSGNNGNVTWMPFPEYLTPSKFFSYDGSAMAFFNSGNNILSIISQEKDTCLSDSSQADIVIYLWQPVLSNLYEQDPTIIRGFDLYPNPAESFLNLKLLGFIEEEVLYTVYDISGKVIQQNKIPAKKAQIDISSLPAGLYLLKLTDTKFSETKKFQVIR